MAKVGQLFPRSRASLHLTLTVFHSSRFIYPWPLQPLWGALYVIGILVRWARMANIVGGSYLDFLPTSVDTS